MFTRKISTLYIHTIKESNAYLRKSEHVPKSYKINCLDVPINTVYILLSKTTGEKNPSLKSNPYEREHLI